MTLDNPIASLDNPTAAARTTETSEPRLNSVDVMANSNLVSNYKTAALDNALLEAKNVIQPMQLTDNSTTSSGRKPEQNNGNDQTPRNLPGEGSGAMAQGARDARSAAERAAAESAAAAAAAAVVGGAAGAIIAGALEAARKAGKDK